MNKIIISVLAFLSFILSINVSAAFNETNSADVNVAVIDTALDRNVNTLQGKISHEVCILESNSCPNGKNFQEGPGSSYIPLKFFNKNGFDHGTLMTSVLTKANPDIKVVFVRIVGHTLTGERRATTENAFINALDWIIKNKYKFNIQAVTMSQGHHNLLDSLSYCPNTPRTVEKIKDLIAMDVPIFLPTGNIGDYKRIDWPACIDESISVGSVSNNGKVPDWSNMDMQKVDLYTLGFFQAMRPTSQRMNISGTSVSTQIAAAQWLSVKKQYPELTYSQLLDKIRSTSIKVSNPVGITGFMINIKAALNG